VGQDAGLGGDAVGGDDVRQHVVEPYHLFHVVGCGIDADHGVAAAVQQAVEYGCGDALEVVGRMVGLQAVGQASRQAQGVTKTRHDADLGSRQHQVLHAHDL